MRRLNRNKLTRALLANCFPGFKPVHFSKGNMPDSGPDAAPAVYWGYATVRSKRGRRGRLCDEGTYGFCISRQQVLCMLACIGTCQVAFSLGGNSGLAVVAPKNTPEFIREAERRMAANGSESITILIRRRRGGGNFRLRFAASDQSQKCLLISGWKRLSAIKRHEVPAVKPVPAAPPVTTVTGYWACFMVDFGMFVQSLAI